MDLTNLVRGCGVPAVMSDCGVAHDSDSLLAAVVLRVSMIKAGCPLGDDHQIERTDLVVGKGLVEEWMPEDCAAQDLNPFSLNAWVRPADRTMTPACRKKVARELDRTRDEGVPVLHRAIALAKRNLRAR